VSAAEGRGGTYVLFRLGDEEFGLPIESVTGVVRYEIPTPVPRSPESVLGVVNLRGRVMPVLDLGKRFAGAPFQPRSNSRIVVTEGANGAVGVAVDVASEVVTFSDDAVRSVPERVLGPETVHAFIGMVERPTGIVVLLDPEQAMPSHEVRPATEAFDRGEKEGRDV
jgi:purine-binding chemotaxis protein CheW